MSKIASKLSRQIMAVLLSVAMILPNMTVYASEVSVPETQDEITVDNGELDVEQPSLTEGETQSDEGGEDETLPENDASNEESNKGGEDSEDEAAPDEEKLPDAEAVYAELEADEQDFKTVLDAATPLLDEVTIGKKWIFTAPTAADANYNTPPDGADGLTMTGVKSEQKSHAALSTGSTIGIPVPGDCTIIVTYYYAANATIGKTETNAGETFTTSSSSDSTFPYSYIGSKGTVYIEAAGTTYIKSIELAEPIYPVAINVVNTTPGDTTKLTAHDLAGLGIKLTKGGATSTYVINEDGEIKLEAGEYTAVAIGDNNSYIQGVTLACAESSLTVSDASASLTINVSDYTSEKEITSWDWKNDTNLQSDFHGKFGSIKDDWYKGLNLVKVVTSNAGQQVTIKSGGKIGVPVKGKCNISISTFYNAQVTVGGSMEVDKGYDVFTYPYTKDAVGYVDIVNTGTKDAYIDNITIKPMGEETYTVTLKPTGAGITVADLHGAEIVFTDSESKEKEPITVPDNATEIKVEGIEAGAYTVDVYKSGIFVQQNADATLTVAGNCEHEITFKSYITQWDFSDSKFQSDRYKDGAYNWYKGLDLVSVKTGGGKYAYLNTASSVIKIPVRTNCKITVDYYEQKAENTEIATIGEMGATNPTEIVGAATNGDFDTEYTYSGEAGEVLISAKTDFYVSKIAIEYLEPTKPVTIQAKYGKTVLTDEDLAGSVITFTDIQDADNHPSFTIGTGEGEVSLGDIELKEGTYKVSVYNSNVYVQQTTDNLTVGGDGSVTCVIPFDAYLTEWSFNNTTFQSTYTQAAKLTWYNGLEIKNAYAHNNYLYMGTGYEVDIPVKGACSITVGYYDTTDNPAKATIGADKVPLPNGQTSYEYPYDGEAGYVKIAATATTYLETISINYPSTPGGNDDDDTPDPYTAGIDVWDFGAQQLSTATYNNKLTEDILNDSYDYGTGQTKGMLGKDGIKSFQIMNADGSLDFEFNANGKTNHRLRTTNTKLTRHDEKSISYNNTTYTGYIYSNSEKDAGVYVGVRLNAGDVMKAIVSSNGGDYTITVEAPDKSKQLFARPAGPSEIVYYAAQTGFYKIYNGTDEKLVVARVTREHNKRVTVSGTVQIPEGVTEELKLEFTCKQSGMVKEAVIKDGAYEVKLYENHDYDVISLPRKYVITKGAELKLGAANADATATHNVEIEAVTLRELTGSIVGIEDADIGKMQIIFERPTGELYIPETTINKTDKTYTVELADGVEYTVVTKDLKGHRAINDYQLVTIGTDTSGKISITENTRDMTLTYEKKPVHKVTIVAKEGTEDVTAALKEEGAVVKFTNLGLRTGCEDDEGYIYTFNLTDTNIALRDGVYNVEVSNSGAYVQKLTSNLVVNGADVSKEIMFDSNITEWVFSDPGFTGGKYSSAGEYNYNGLRFTNGSNNKIYLLHNAGTISVPVKGPSTITVKSCYKYSFYFKSENEKSYNYNPEKPSTDDIKSYTYDYTGDAGYVDITVKGQSYINSISVKEKVGYKDTITVGSGAGYDYSTINDALDAVRKMDRTGDQAVTISIQPGDYEEMLVIDEPNIKLVNASPTPSIELKDNGVHIDSNAVRITAYYGHGYSYYSMGTDCKWNAEILAVNKANGYESYTNPGSGSTDGSYWNASVVISASNVSAEGIIFENSFNQYVSRKAADDVIVKQGSAKEGATPRADMQYGDITVQDKAYVERAAALAITKNCKQISFDNCRFIGHQDTLYGGDGVTAAFYGCSVGGGTDYIMGGMTAVFAKCELEFFTADDNNDVGYITAAQQTSGRGYLMYNCHVTSAKPGKDISETYYTSKPGYFGRPWAPNTGEALFYYTIIDEADTHWHTQFGKSLIMPAGWLSTLQGESVLSQEYATYEKSGVDNQTARVSWSTKLTDTDARQKGKVSYFLGTWDAFAGKDMTIDSPLYVEPVQDPTAEPETGSTLDTAAEVEIGASVTLKSATDGATIYYTISKDGNAPADPTATETNLYNSAITLDTKGTTIIKAMAVKAGIPDSDIATFVYVVKTASAVKKPVADPEAPCQVLATDKIKLSLADDAAEGTKIYYTTGKTEDETAKPVAGAEGTTEYVLNSDGILIGENPVIKAIAVAVVDDETQESEVAVFKYTIIAADAPKLATPTAKINGAAVSDNSTTEVDENTNVTVTLEAEAGTTIYYTDDNSTPTRNSKPYTDSGISISSIAEAKTIKAFAIQDGKRDSDVLTINISIKKKITEKGFVVTVLEKDHTYTGNAITPAIKVTNNGVTLTEGIDYTVKYSNNIKANEDNPKEKQAKIVVTGKGNLSAGATHYFEIKKRPLTDESVYKPASLAVVKNKKVAPILTYDGAILSAKDYTIDPSTLKFSEVTPEGTAIANLTTKVKIEGKGNYKGTVEIPVKVVEKASDLDKFTVKLSSSTFNYDGTAHMPEFEVKDAKTKADVVPTGGNASEYYVVKCSDNINAGKVKVTLIGVNQYAGCSVSKTFTIKPKAEPAGNFEVKLGKADKKYTFVSTGVNVAGDMTVNYTAGTAPLKLTEGKDYKVTCSNNKKVSANAKYKVTFIGNYKGSKPVSGDFEIVAAPLDNSAKVVLADMVYNGKKLYKSNPYVMLGDTLLKKGSEYTVEYYMDSTYNTPIDKLELADDQTATIYVKITGKGSYAPADAATTFAKGEYKVCPKGEKIDLSKAKVTLYEPDATDSSKASDKVAKKMEYTGDGLKPIAVVQYKDGKEWKTVEAENYTVSYVNNVNKGKATVVINPAEGKNTCVGGKTAAFSIVARNLKNLENVFKNLTKRF